MDTYLIEVPIPSMGATVNELTVVTLKTRTGDHVTIGNLHDVIHSPRATCTASSVPSGAR